jgi:uncharacterized protein
MDRQWRWVLVAWLVFAVTPVWAQYDLKELTPAVRQALDQRRDRFDEIKALKAKGMIGENNQGYLEVLVSDNRASELARAENHDRLMIYKTIVEQNGLEGALSTVEKVFAQVQAGKAEAGEMVQNNAGRWIKVE